VTPEQDLPAADLRVWSASLSQEIADLRAELQRCQSALAEAEEKQALVQRLLELDGQPSEPLPNPNGDEAGEPSRRATTMTRRAVPTSHDLEDAVAAILEEAKKPLHVSDIRLRLISEGVRIPGRGDDANVIVRLRKAPERFTRTARGTYALASWRLPSLDNAVARRKRSRARR
jgi:hypothetical protein